MRELDPTPVVFIALHGPFGEDGTVQALCESADAGLHRRRRGGIGGRHGQGHLQAPHGKVWACPWCRGSSSSAAEWQADPHAVQRRIEEFASAQADPRVVVKPTRLGSSVGISIVHKPDDAEYTGGAISASAALRRRGHRRGVPGPRARARDERAGQLRCGPGELRPGRDLSRPRVLRLHRQVQRWRIANDRSRPRSTTRPARADPRHRPRCVPGDRQPRASRESTSCSTKIGRRSI